MEKFEQLKAIVEASEADFVAFFEKGNKTAGTRVRKSMLEIKNLAAEVRKEVSDIKNSK